MNLGDCLLGLYEKALPFSLNWDEKLGMVKALGYDFLEFSIDGDHTERLDWSEEEISAFMEASTRAGVPIYSIALTANRKYPLGSKDKKIRDAGIAVLKKAIILAPKIGASIVQIATYDVYGEEKGDAETDMLFLESLRECEPMAASSGTMLALETMDTPYADSIELCKRIVDIIGSPWVQIYADNGNIAAAGYDFTQEIFKGAVHVVAIHLKDAKPGIMRDIDYGTGIVDFDADLTALKQAGFSGLFIAEMWGTDDPAYREKAGAACRFLREKIKAADAVN